MLLFRFSVVHWNFTTDYFCLIKREVIGICDVFVIDLPTIILDFDPLSCHNARASLRHRYQMKWRLSNTSLSLTLQFVRQWLISYYFVDITDSNFKGMFYED